MVGRRDDWGDCVTAVLIYLAIVVTTVIQSTATKLFSRGCKHSLAFNALKGAASFLLFLVISLPNFTFHLPTVMYGVGFGLVIAVSMYSGFKALGMGPMGLSTLLISFSVIIPMIYGLTAGNETLGVLQIVAMALLVVSILLSNYDKLRVKKSPDPEPKKKSNYGRWLFFVFATFASNGFSSVLQKSHQEAFPGMYNCEFNFFGMTVCALIFVTLALIKVPKEEWRATKGKGYGVLAGLSNSTANLLTLNLAGFENAVVLFPIISVGTILGAVICGWVVFKEKLKLNHYLSLLTGIAAVILLKV